MIRSEFAITRLVVLPYLVLLVFYLAVIGIGGAWLWNQLRTVETGVLIEEMIGELEPLAQRLRSGDALAAMRDSEAWLVTDVERLFAGMPALRNVSVRGVLTGYQMESNALGAVSTRAASPLPTDARRATAYRPADERLHGNAEALFLELNQTRQMD